MLVSQILHEIEKKIIISLRDEPKQTLELLVASTKLSEDQIRRGIQWLKLKNLAVINESKTSMYSLDKNGLESLENGLPERRLLDLLADGPKSISYLQKELGVVFGAAIGLARKNNWISTSADQISLDNKPEYIPGEKTLLQIGSVKIAEDQVDRNDLDALQKKPDFIIQDVIKTLEITLSPAAESIDLTHTGIDVEAQVPSTVVARTHPLKDTIDEIREIFVTLGFSEIIGNMTQSSFWNFDALFTPQDHPARELQDTFYLDGISAKNIATALQINKVSQSHTKHWQYPWDIKAAQKMVLRTHTTCVTIKHLAQNKLDDARVFSLGRVFRNEKVSYKHLVEFNQVEGVVVGKGATLRDLMGIQREFYKRIGITKIKFWPTFFPYTEPSLQTMVYNERLGKWIELFGMGIFRPEVTRPLGIKEPVLAWGGGIERIAMLKYCLDDVREFYANNLSWLRGVTPCQ